MFPGLGKRGAGEQWTDEREETNRQKPRGGLPSTSGRKEVGKKGGEEGRKGKINMQFEK